MRDEESELPPPGSVRERAIRSGAEGEPVELAVVWRGLCLGTARLVDAFHTDERCFLLLAPSTPNHKHLPLPGQNVDLLERVLSGSGSKVVAIELGASASTVSFRLQQSARKLGLGFRVSNMPPLLMMAAHAARRGVRIEGCRSKLSWRGQSLVVISAARPDRSLAECVSAAEYAVTQLLVEGHPYSEIAARRGTSTRTVANQLSAVFRKLEVSGRSQLMTALMSRYPPRPSAQSPSSPA
jgi:DNA-binding NarL/FixJ family response regulator